MSKRCTHYIWHLQGNDGGCLEVYPLIDNGASQLHYRQTSASLVLPITTTKECKNLIIKGGMDKSFGRGLYS
ncbi:hypothetical protein TSUD_96190 [Trifolium subterraneum]|nr:hypothetical protein TSUD_96190 [Trifolium subterraneum]